MSTEKKQERSAARQRTEAIFKDLRDRICTNIYPPGTILREEDLSREFMVSRSPVRRVFSMLEQAGMVTVRHGVGNVVTNVEPDKLVEVHSVRMILAQAAGEYFTTPFPPEIYDLLEECKQEFRNLDEGDVVRFGEINIRYYTGLTNLITNTCLRDLQQSLFFQTSRMWLISLPTMPWAETIDAISDELDELIRVMKLEDPVGLALVARNHIFMSRRRILAGLAEQAQS